MESRSGYEEESSESSHELEFPEAAFIREVGLPNVGILDIIFGSHGMEVQNGSLSDSDSDSEASTVGSDVVELMKKVKRRLAKIPELKSDEALAMFCKELFVDLSKRVMFCAIQWNRWLLWLQNEFNEFNKTQQESQVGMFPLRSAMLPLKKQWPKLFNLM